MGIKSGNYGVISRATYNLGSNLRLDVKNMGVSWNLAPQIRLIIISPHFPHKKMNPCELNQVKSTIFRHPKVSKGWTPHLPCFGHPFGAMDAPWASGSYARERWEPAQCPCDRPRCDLGMGYLGLEKRLVSGKIFGLSWVSGSPFFCFYSWDQAGELFLGVKIVHGPVTSCKALITLSGHTQVSSDNAATRRGNRLRRRRCFLLMCFFFHRRSLFRICIYAYM